MMYSSNDIDYDEQMSEVFQPMTTDIHYYERPLSNSTHQCVVCGSKAVGINFGVITCAPCKAFFRRNARRKEILHLPCRHRDLTALMRNHIEYNERTMRYLQIRRCSSCRLRRCFNVGMKEELVRTDEENERQRQLIDINRKQREMLKQQLVALKQLSIPQLVVNNNEFSQEIDWSHLSNIIYAYDTYCLKTFIQQRSTIVFNRALPITDEQSTNKHPTTLTMSIVMAVSSFLKALPAYYSLPRTTRNYLCKTNIRPLIFPNIHELNQSCFSEPWQVTAYNSTWELMCGPQLYEQFTQAEQLAAKLWITDPVITRLWIIVLFFSTPLHYHHDCSTITPILKKKHPLLQVQNGYVTLLWKYLLHRHGFLESVRIYANLIHVYLKMQSVGFGIYVHLRSQRDLLPTHETLNKLVTLDINEDKKQNNAKKTYLSSYTSSIMKN